MPWNYVTTYCAICDQDLPTWLMTVFVNAGSANRLDRLPHIYCLTLSLHVQVDSEPCISTLNAIVFNLLQVSLLGVNTLSINIEYESPLVEQEENHIYRQVAWAQWAQSWNRPNQPRRKNTRTLAIQTGYDVTNRISQCLLRFRFKLSNPWSRKGFPT